jgi:predicted metal-binding membrane protein
MADVTGPALRPGPPHSRFPLHLQARWRRFLRGHPEVLALFTAALAWPVTMLLHEATGQGSGAAVPEGAASWGGTAEAHLGHAGHGAGASGGAPAAYVALAELIAWAVMVTAMMVPLVWPAVRHVGLNSLRWRRQRAIAAFLAAYIAVWTVFGAVVIVARGLLTAVHAPALAAALAVAGLWQLSPLQVRFRRACHRTVPLPPRGLPAVAGDLRFGARQGVACIGVCWPLMLAMALVPGAILMWMTGLTATMACAKLLPRSYRLSRPLAASLGTAAALMLV